MKRVLVTGASRGIGKTICEHFLSHGCEVIGVARAKAEAPYPIVECDLGQVSSLERGFASVLEHYGTPDVLINNAGIYCAASVTVETIEQFEATMNVNVRAVFRLTQLFAENLCRQSSKGSVVNISSISGRIGSIDAAYAASKGAVDALTKSFARGYASAGIRVNAVAPGPINTEMGESIPEERKQHYLQSILQRRFGEPSEVAHLVYFLASDEASLITGDVIYPTGGML